MRDGRIGSLLGQRFRIEERVAAGGFGVLYRAMDTQRAEPVALKVLSLEDESERRRFEREGDFLAKISHPNVVGFVCDGRAQDGSPWLAMQWLDGVDLRARLAQRGPLTVASSIVMIERVAEALSAVHDAGVIHRDVKPGNIFLRDGDTARPVLVDFGIATGRDVASLTRPGVMIGTPSYMAPEQVMARGDIDRRADLFSLGCVWFESLVGRAPFVAEQIVAVLAKVMLTDAPTLSSTGLRAPSSIEALLAKLLARDREARLASATHLLDALSALRGRPSMLPPSATGTRAALTRAELRVRSVLVAATPMAVNDHTLPTLELRAIHRAIDRIREEAERQSVRLYEFADRSWTAVVEQEGRDARDSAVALARVGLVARAALPTLPVAMATGRAQFEGQKPPMGAVIDEAAALLSQPLIAGALYADEATAALLDATLPVEAQHEHRVVRAEGPRVERTLLGKLTPFVGREHEFYTGIAQVTRAFDERAASSTLFIGEAGVGKSRLVSELRRAVTQRWPAARVLVARCTSGSQSAALSLASSVVRAVVDEREHTVEALLRFVAQRGESAPHEQLEHGGFLAALGGYPEDARLQSAPLLAARGDARLMREQMARSLEWAIGAECERAPLALVIEDAHWSDEASVRMIEGVIAACGERRLAVITAARPEVRERFSRLFCADRGIELSLGELSRGASVALARSALGSTAAQDEVDALVARSAGNAFFLEELIRGFAEHGSLSTLPDSVAAMVSARFERLDERARRVLRAASVFGRTFWASAVAALLGPDSAPSVDESIDRLLRQEVIGRRGSGRFAGEREYVFRHAILGDVAYEALTDEDRALGHKLAARWLDRQGGVEPAVLAMHYERGADLLMAAPWYMQAARRAMEGEDYRQTLSHASAVERCDSQGILRGEIALTRAEANRWLPDHGAFEQNARAAMEAFEPGSDRWCESASLHCIALGVLERAGELAESCSTLVAAARVSLADKRLLLLARLSIHLCACGELQLARLPIRELESALARTAVADPNLRGNIAAARAAWSHFDGDAQGYARHVAESIVHFDVARNSRGAAAQRSNLGYALMDLGDLDAAERSLRDTIARVGALSIHQVVGFCKHNLGLLLSWKGAHDEGLRVEREALAWFEAQQFIRFVGASKLYIADILLSAGRADEAVEPARQAAIDLENVGVMRAQAHSTLARALAITGSRDEALRVAREAATAAGEQQGIDASSVWIWRNVAEAFARAGAEPEAALARAEAVRALDERARKVSDAEARARFSSAIPDHALVCSWR